MRTPPTAARKTYACVCMCPYGPGEFFSFLFSRSAGDVLGGRWGKDTPGFRPKRFNTHSAFHPCPVPNKIVLVSVPLLHHGPEFQFQIASYTVHNDRNI